MHTIVVVPREVALVILGVDFMHANSLVLDFTQTSVCVCHANVDLVTLPRECCLRWHSAHRKHVRRP